MKVLLINGSPHRNGCTFTALDEVAKQLEKENVECEIYHIGNKPIRGCIGCGKCQSSDKHLCIFNDDSVNEVIEKAKDADGFIFGSPVYFASANGSMTSLLDRVNFAASSNFAYKPAASIVSARRAGTTAAYDQLNKYIGHSKMIMVPSTYWNMVHGFTPEQVRQDEEGMQIMRTLGTNMAWLLKLIESGKKNGINYPVNEKIIRTNFIK
ncbi:flavodoxin family protein [Clostridium sp. SHJSY1]|uniref:flavodoxin family protein n=1 Tax=Clostridium sp. SHJSY1 TaxID=2942483 RepID=UPI0028753E0A|nr:flavodoxin family protein [Clostridium sp. SHJSY1]MDS0524299.1 flavodoxin family protein [Clostridium sp. SHJSY1]